MAQAVTPKTVIVYADEKGREPFTDWLNGLKDARDRRRILARLRRIELGNLGDRKHLQNSVFELRLFFGPGYRVYFGEAGESTILLLCGGDKSTQDEDIDNAIAYWQEYQSHDQVQNPGQY